MKNGLPRIYLNGETRLEYNENLYYFAISFLWRVIVINLTKDPNIAKSWYFEILKKAEKEWRDFLAEVIYPNQFNKINLFFTDRVKSNTTAEDYIKEVAKVLKSGKKIYINGANSNPYFRDLTEYLANQYGFVVEKFNQPLLSRFNNLTFYQSDLITNIPKQYIKSTVNGTY